MSNLKNVEYDFHALQYYVILHRPVWYVRTSVSDVPTAYSLS
jgi:hypothetical protein